MVEGGMSRILYRNKIKQTIIFSFFNTEMYHAGINLPYTLFVFFRVCVATNFTSAVFTYN